MLDNLRAMGVFACVVKQGSFSGAAKELGITTSAVSQQIRALESELNVSLLHRSTRKLSLTEAGNAFFQSCQEMMLAAERGKIRLTELQDDLMGELRIATTPELAALHVIPALSCWIKAHTDLKVKFITSHHYIDLEDEQIDIAIRMSLDPHSSEYDILPLARVEQLLIASPVYLRQNPTINRPEDLVIHQLLPVDSMKNYGQFTFTHRKTSELVKLEMPVKLSTNNVLVMKTLCQYGHGIARILYLDAQREIRDGELVEILPEWKLPEYTLYAMTAKNEQPSIKVVRCLDALKNYFSQFPGGR